MIFIIILLIIVILFLVIYNNKLKKEQQNKYKNIREQAEQDFIFNRKKELEEELTREFESREQLYRERHRLVIESLEQEQRRLRETIKNGEKTIAQLEKRKEEQIKAINEAVNDKKKIVDTEIEAYRTVETQKAATAVTEWAKSARELEEASFAAYKEGTAQKKQEMQNELNIIQQSIDTAKTELEDYKKKQQAVNEAILRQRELEEKQDFYRVCLSEFAIEDITLLQEIRQKLHTTESFNKLIYDVYVSKQVQEMVKRVLQGGAPSGIYKITRLKTGEVYIGKSTNVKDRWQQHCKTVFGAGTIAHSILHTTMQKDGLQNFTFELIEEVPKEKLSEREKYWITFYDSKNYGLNERNG